MLDPTNTSSPFRIVGASGFGQYAEHSGPSPRIGSLLIKPASALCNLDCSYCFYLDRQADPYKDLAARRMSDEVQERLVRDFLFYSYPNSTFAFQGGEPTLAGVDFFRRLVRLQKEHGRDGQSVSNALQTNGMLIDEAWCELFREYNWLIGISIDGPEAMHDLYRFNKGGEGTWKRVMQSIRLMQKEKVEFNCLVVVSQANVGKAREVYRFFRSIGVDNLQYIPLSEFDENGQRLPFTITAEQYGRFLVETFEEWWPERRRARVRYFDNIAEAIAGQRPGSCTMHETCDSYCVVEYNGDVFPCDFFVRGDWKLGNVMEDSWATIARRSRRYSFASKKTIAHPECQACEYQSICHGGCPKSREGQKGDFADLDYFCAAYKMIFERAVGPLKDDLSKMLGREIQLPARHHVGA
jgi:uncharacterized protein